MIKICFTLMATMMLLACSSASVVQLEIEPSAALLATNNSPQCYQELKSRLSEQMGQPVTVSANVFSSESRLLLEPFTPRDVNGIYKDGLSLAKPKLFNLLILNQ